MKLPQEIIDLIFFYVHRLKQEKIIQQMRDCLFYSYDMLYLVKIIGAYVGLDIQCRYQFRNIEDLNDPIPIPQQYLNIKNFKSISQIPLPHKYFYTSGFNHPSAYKNAY